MEELYHISGLTKQALFKYRQRQTYLMKVSSLVVDKCKAIRIDHKRMSCKRMYVKVKEEVPIGRDIFEQIGFANGFRIKQKRNVHKTTWSQQIEVCPNLIEGLVINGINQVWQTDLFYINIEGEPHYGVTIMDVYSRYLLALHIANSMEAIHAETALKEAIAERDLMVLVNCILHSDKGSQFISLLIKNLATKMGMKRSMATIAQENAYVERIQGTLKYEYLFEQRLNKKSLKNQCRRIKQLYNKERPHSSLKMLTPHAFEQLILNMDEEKRPQMRIYKWQNPLLTNNEVANKKEKRSKKEKSYNSNITH